MKVLASRIVEELKTADHCAVYETELERFWPLSVNGREAKITRFAQEHGLRLRFYKPGLCAIFDREAAMQRANGDGDDDL
ncbi:MAG TPA: hypothetical protein VGM62_10250 [Chthoniobacterales bacterium]|jgi:hypothetical protein